MDFIEEKLSQLSFDEFEHSEEDKLAERACRTSWKIGSKVEVYSQSSNAWIDGEIVSQVILINNYNNKPNSLLPPPWLTIDYYKHNTLYNKHVFRYNDMIRPRTEDIQRIKHQNKASFTFFRDAKDNFLNLNEIKNNISKRDNAYYKVLVTVTDLMSESRSSKDNWLTPKAAWNDVMQLIVGKVINVALDPFFGDDAMHILWLEQYGFTLKQSLCDFFNIHYLPPSIQCILSNPPYKPTKLRQIFVKLKSLQMPFGLLVPNWIFTKPKVNFWNIFDEKDELYLFESEGYKFEICNQSGVRQKKSDAPFVPIWLFGNFKKEQLNIKWEKTVINDKPKLSRIYFE